MRTSCLALIGAVGLLAASAAAAAPFIYPANGQDQATQAKDEAECSTLATQQTGFTPGAATAPSALTALTGTPSDTSAVVPALGAIPGGGAASAMGSVDRMGDTSQAMAGQTLGAPQKPPSQANYERDRTACLTGRGYTVQ